MKTKEEIMKMSAVELLAEKREMKLKGNSTCSGCLSCSDCSSCYDCSHCLSCSVCSSCSDCYSCINITRKQYMICNVQFTKEEYEAKMKELKEAK